MDSAYLKLISGARLTSHMGLRLDEGFEYRYGRNYLYLEIPLLGVRDEKGELVKEVKRNQHVLVECAATVDVKGRSFIEIEPNAALAEFGQVQGTYRLHPDSGEQRLGFYLTARKDVDLSSLTYGVRLYMPT